MPLLEKREKFGKLTDRKSNFLLNELELLRRMIEGEYQYDKFLQSN